MILELMKFPSRVKSLQWLLIAAVCFWIIPSEGKQNFPSLFQIAWVRWVSNAVWGLNALIIPLGFFLSIHALFSSDAGSKARRYSGWTGVGFFLLFCMSLFFQLSVVFGTNEVLYKLSAPDWIFSESDILPRISAKAAGEKSAQKREKLSAAAYQVAGIAIPYQQDDGSYVPYHPSAKANERWVQHQQMYKSTRLQISMIFRQIHQILWDALIEFSLFFVIVLGGILLFTYRRGKESLP